MWILCEINVYVYCLCLCLCLCVRYSLSASSDGALEEAAASVARGHAVVLAGRLIPADATHQLRPTLLHGRDDDVTRGDVTMM